MLFVNFEIISLSSLIMINRLGKDETGIRVAEVQADLDLHGVTVVTTAETQSVYNDDPNILITGEG